VNISCVNALAASDYVLVPTTLSRKSIERVPLLLRKILRNEQFVRFINPKLQVLGLVANRTYRDDLSGAERADWNQVAAWCRDAYGTEVPRFSTPIPQIKEVRDSEAEFTAGGTGGRLEAVFGQLAAEIERELPSECRRAAKTPS
jgi:cellulose biosynthesis protein BcsQ